MIKITFNLFCIILVLLQACAIVSADTTTRGTMSTNSLRVCADPSNLPFSNDKLEGFENKIIEIIGGELEKPIHYTWYPQSTGYVRNTLQLHQCDLITGITIGNERVQNTNPYYHSIYTLVYPLKNDPLSLDFSDPVYKNKTIGIVAGTPAANLMVKYGLLANIKPYQLMVDTRHFSSGKQIIEDIESGVIDAAIVWGPIAAYYANLSKEDIAVIPLIEETKSLTLDYGITMAVRFNDQDWKHRVNEILKNNESEIISILHDYKVPILNNAGQLIAQ